MNLVRGHSWQGGGGGGEWQSKSPGWQIAVSQSIIRCLPHLTIFAMYQVSNKGDILKKSIHRVQTVEADCPDSNCGSVPY